MKLLILVWRGESIVQFLPYIDSLNFGFCYSWQWPVLIYLWVSSVLSESLKIDISLRRLSSRNKKLPLSLHLERLQSTHKAFSPHISGTDKSPTAPKAPRSSPHIRDTKVFGNSLGNISWIWANHILTVSSATSSTQVLWEFWGSFSPSFILDYVIY